MKEKKDERGLSEIQVSFSDQAIVSQNPYYIRLMEATGDCCVDTDTVLSETLACLEWLKENCEQPLDDLKDEMLEEIDSRVDFASSELTEWLNKDISNVLYIDEAIKEFGLPESGFQLLSRAQHLAIAEVWNAVISIFEE